ncbi:cobalt ABC transporter substrate-binding protein CbiN [Tumebacillus algifaecis]|uniref:Cobalt transport protein CbiN n=1 Tax=Tumebacillus algifaecis TaxID=1214604 RepID=A0A223CWM4_9BACL|nr:energy-coupling factor ABC transporter substrate-binding protein [Tumebacillus algifaecis]ASS73701.1 cobalt ABC transporter substrate-binding protein CbiN [Tumebacillus algifaecis]
MKIGMKNALLLLAVILLALLPLLLINAEFGGADGAAEEAILEIDPTYEPWFNALTELPSETESMLFALQAALGAGVVGYTFGRLKGKSTQAKTQ